MYTYTHGQFKDTKKETQSYKVLENLSARGKPSALLRNEVSSCYRSQVIHTKSAHMWWFWILDNKQQMLHFISHCCVSRVNLEWMDSALCSPKRPKPTCYWVEWANWVAWSSSICILMGTVACGKDSREKLMSCSNDLLCINDKEISPPRLWSH